APAWEKQARARRLPWTATAPAWYRTAAPQSWDALPSFPQRGSFMRNLLAFLGALSVTVGVAGWYLDWYRVRSHPAPTGHKSVSIDIDTGKIGQDLHRGEQGIQKVIEAAGKT